MFSAIDQIFGLEFQQYNSTVYTHNNTVQKGVFQSPTEMTVQFLPTQLCEFEPFI